MQALELLETMVLPDSKDIDPKNHDAVSACIARFAACTVYTW